MDRWDFVLKFSGEITVFLIALSVAFLNIFYFSWSKSNFVDQSYAAKFLNYHPEFNNQLYAKNSTIITTIESSKSFIPKAQAQTLSSLNSQNLNEPEVNTETELFNEYILEKPNPDSIQNLISKQIKVYETKYGDTLGAIASENGISVQTIKQTNLLPSEFIKPGWFLIILPTDGVFHEADSNDTLPDIANKYKGDLAKIIAYNGLENAEDIDGGQLIIIPGGTLPASMLPQPIYRDNYTATVNPEGATRPRIVDNGTGHIFPWGYCTWYVASKTHVPWGGNAKNWISNSRGDGAVISNTPAVGSIVATTDNSRYGHVAYVEKVENGRIFVSEMNYKGFGIVNTRWINTNSRTIKGYIHP